MFTLLITPATRIFIANQKQKINNKMGCIKSQCIRLLLIITGALVLVTPFWYDHLEGEHVSSFKSQVRSRWSNIIQARKSEHLLTDVIQSLDPMSRDSYPDGMSLLFNVYTG